MKYWTSPFTIFSIWSYLASSLFYEALWPSPQDTPVGHVRGGGNVATVCFTNTSPLVIH